MTLTGLIKDLPSRLHLLGSCEPCVGGSMYNGENGILTAGPRIPLEGV